LTLFFCLGLAIGFHGEIRPILKEFFLRLSAGDGFFCRSFNYSPSVKTSGVLSKILSYQKNEIFFGA
jgi:hypothetical protein